MSAEPIKLFKPCPCGKPHELAEAGHYDRFKMSCGRLYWTLQPKRNGPLVLYPWPGPNLKAWELAELEAHQDGTPYVGAQNI
jgi:hypothetical protein